MLVEKPNEPIRVMADFYGAKVRPEYFIRGNRRYEVKSINLVFRRAVGDHYLWCFAVSDDANTFVLSYNPDSLQWRLEEVQMDG